MLGLEFNDFVKGVCGRLDLEHRPHLAHGLDFGHASAEEFKYVVILIMVLLSLYRTGTLVATSEKQKQLLLTAHAVDFEIKKCDF